MNVEGTHLSRRVQALLMQPNKLSDTGDKSTRTIKNRKVTKTTTSYDVDVCTEHSDAVDYSSGLDTEEPSIR